MSALRQVTSWIVWSRNIIKHKIMKTITIHKQAIATITTGLLLATPWLVGAQDSQGLQNPIRVNSIQELLVILLNLVIVIATPIVVLFIILAGFKYVTAGEILDKFKRRHKHLRTPSSAVCSSSVR